jgi:pimeloyl-ACP methyl ester carboxylesterase
MIVLVLLALALIAFLAFVVYIVRKYTPIVARIFEERPFFMPLRIPPATDGEAVRFRTSDQLDLAGGYFKARTSTRTGVLVFCHEYLSDRWSFKPYADPLRDLGFDIFTFDFRNHGDSERDATYQPLQWVSDHEIRDLQAALNYLRSRPDHDPAGFGLYGISRGGSAALVAAAREPAVWGVITDGAFPTRGTMSAYILRWAEIYITNATLWRLIPHWVLALLSWSARARSQRRLYCRFLDVEKAVSRLAPRPWLMIHGAKDAYIGPAIAQALFDQAKEPKEFWLVPGAKHNRCREGQPELYAERVASFVRRYAPRLPAGANRQAVLVGMNRSEDYAREEIQRAPSVVPGASLAGGLSASMPG